MKVRDLPPGPLLSVEPETTIAEVARHMRKDDSDSVVVLSEGRLVGIITERDLVRAIADGVVPSRQGRTS
ncbi:MAG: CBS domain-containing protein [Candidatus Dormiibacterota bacterium]